MRFYKPSLLKKFRSESPAVSRPAAERLDEQADAYVARLKEVRRLMPDSMRAASRRANLHDSRLVRAEGWLGRPRIHLTLRLAGGQTLLLRYRTATDDPKENVETFRYDIASQPGEGLSILHDEFDHDEKAGVFTHSILFGNGLELRIKMRDVSARIGEPFEIVPQEEVALV